MAQLPFQSQTSEGYKDEQELSEERPSVPQPNIPGPSSIPDTGSAMDSVSSMADNVQPVGTESVEPVLPTTNLPNYRTRPLNVQSALDATSPRGERVIAQPEIPEYDLLNEGMPEVGIAYDTWQGLEQIRTTEVGDPRYYMPSVDPERGDYDYIDEQYQSIAQNNRQQLTPEGYTHPLDTPTRGAAVTAPLRSATTGTARGIIGSTVPGQVIQQLQRVEEETGYIGWLGRTARALEEDISSLIGGAWQGIINAPGAAINQYRQRVEEVGPLRANLEALRNLASAGAPIADTLVPGNAVGRVRDTLPTQGITTNLGRSFETAALQLPGATITDEDIERLSAAPESERVGFLQDFIQRSPEVQRLLERIAPQETEPGSDQYLFSPSRGAFGEYGSGTFGGLLYLANTVESVVGGALTDIYDVGSFVTTGRVGESSYRADVLEALTKGRDYGFTNYYDASDRPLGLLNSPAMEFLRVPEPAQWGLSLGADIALGGWTDILTGGVTRGVRAGTRAARAGNSFGTVLSETRRGLRGIPELVPETVNQVSRNVPSTVPGIDEELARQAANIMNAADPGDLPTPSAGTIRVRVDGNDVEIPVVIPTRIRNPEPVQFASVAVSEAVEQGGAEVIENGTIRIWNPETLRGDNVGIISPQYATPAMTPGQVEWAARNAPESIDPADLTRVYRSNEELTMVAKVNGIVPADTQVLTNRQLAALHRDYPNLLGRYGRTIPLGEFEPPGRIIITRRVDEVATTPGEGHILDLPEFTTGGELWTPNNPPSTRRMAKLSNEYSEVAEQLRNAPTQEEATRLARRLDRLDKSIANNMASLPDEQYTRLRLDALPTEQRPRLLDRYGRPLVEAQDRYVDEATTAGRLQAQLAGVEETARKQADAVLENVENVRRNDIDSLATREQYGAEVPPRVEASQTTPRPDDLELDRLIEATTETATEPNLRERIVSYIAESEGIPPQAAEGIVPQELPPGTVTRFDENVTPAQMQWMDETGQPYITPIVIDREELFELFPNREGTLRKAREIGYEGTDDEVLARYAASPAVRRNELVAENNVFPVHFTDEVVSEPTPTPRNIPDNLTQRQYELLDDYTAKQALGAVDDDTMATVRRRLRNTDVGDGITDESLRRTVLADVPRADRDVALRQLVDAGELRYVDGKYFVPEENLVRRTEPINTTPPYKLGIDRALQESAWLHGTKVDAPDFQALNYRNGASVTNELGPGLYLTTDPQLARRYAEAMPVDDIGQVGSRRMTEQGRVIEFKINEYEGYLDADELLDDIEVLGEVFDRTLTGFRAYMSDDDSIRKLSARLKRYLKNHEPRKWAHYITTQARKEGLTNIETRQVLKETYDTLSDYYYGMYHLNRNGHFTMSVLDPSSLDEVRRVPVGNGSVNEGLTSRVVVDAQAHEEYADAITRANVEQSQHRLTDYHRMQLTDAAKQQDIRATEAAREHGLLQREVNASNRKEATERLRRLEQQAGDSAKRQARRTDVDIDPCL